MLGACRVWVWVWVWVCWDLFCTGARVARSPLLGTFHPLAPVTRSVSIAGVPCLVHQPTNYDGSQPLATLVYFHGVGAWGRAPLPGTFLSIGPARQPCTCVAGTLTA